MSHSLSVNPVPQPHMPAVPNFYICPALDQNEKDDLLNGKIQDFQRVINYLKTPDPNRVPKLSRAKEEPCCDNMPFNMVKYTWNNIGQIFKDTFFPCFKCCTNKDIDKKTWITEQIYNQMVTSRIYYHRNMTGLFCIAPAAIIAAPFITTKALLLAATIGAGLITLNAAGSCPYFCSGDFGIQNHDGDLVLEGGFRVGTTLQIQNDYENIAKYIDMIWEQSTPEIHGQIVEDCNDIIKNWYELEDGLRRIGINEENIQKILLPLQQSLDRIKGQFRERSERNLRVLGHRELIVRDAPREMTLTLGKNIEKIDKRDE